MVLFGVLPLLVFVVVDSFAGLKTGVLSAIAFALAEAAYTYYVYRELDGLTIGSLVLVLVFGLFAIKADSPLIFKIQPVVLGLGFGLTLLIMQAMGKPLMVLMAQKYQYLFPAELRERINQPFVLAMFAALSHILGWGFLIHAGLVGYAAFYMSNWWWLAIRGIGLYVMMGICVVLARFSS